MNQVTSPATRTIVEKLQALSQGLLYLSETDHPFEVVYYPYPPVQTSLESLVLSWAGAAEGTPVRKEELPVFFGHLTGETSPPAEQQNDREGQAFRELQSFMQQYLQNVQVYRVGERKLTAFILGKTIRGDYAGLKTQLVET